MGQNGKCFDYLFRMVFYELTVPNSYCGRVIGKGGKKINLITVRNND